MIKEKKLQQILNKTTNKKFIHGAVAHVKCKDFMWQGSAGNFHVDDQFFIASTTKLYTSAIILQLQKEGKLYIEDLITHYLDWQTLEGLHIYKGIEYSHQLKIHHLMAQTSGLPDYFMGKLTVPSVTNLHPNTTLLKEIQSGRDQSWTFEDTVALAKNMGAKFAPPPSPSTVPSSLETLPSLSMNRAIEESSHRALYSDTNFQLLGKIIEKVCKKPIALVFDERIFKPLDLKKTYLYADVHDKKPHAIYYKNNVLTIPKAMASFKADGGIVSTVSELMKFLQAFFNGMFFPIEILPKLYQWNKIFFPLQYGIGLTLFQLPRLFSPFKPAPKFIGHSGLSGTFAFYNPAKNVFLTGSVNQVHQPSISFQMIMKMNNLF